MKSLNLFYLCAFVGSLLSLFIPLWFLPFLISIFVGYYFEVSMKLSLLVHLILYSVVCSLYGLYAYSTGSKELIRMVGQIFEGMSVVTLIVFSSFLFGVTALLGAWVGRALKQNNPNY